MELRLVELRLVELCLVELCLVELCLVELSLVELRLVELRQAVASMLLRRHSGGIAGPRRDLAPTTKLRRVVPHDRGDLTPRSVARWHAGIVLGVVRSVTVYATRNAATTKGCRWCLPSRTRTRY